MCSGSGAVTTEPPAGGRMRQRDRARVQVQLAADPAAELRAPAVAAVLLAAAAVLAVADDRVADRRHLGAELVGAAGDRLERQPGGAAGGGVDGRIVGDRALRPLGGGDAVEGDDEHLLGLAGGAMPRRLDEAGADGAGARARRAGDRGPVDLAGAAGLEGAGERGRGAGRAGEEQHARGVAVEAVDEPRLLGGAEAQRLGEAVDVAAGAGAALHREPRRLVERDDLVVAVEHRGADHRGVGLGDRRLRRRRQRLVGDRRQPHGLPGLEPGRGLHPAAVDADLALAAHALDAGLAHLRVQPAQPAVEALVGVLGADADLADPAHAPAAGRVSSTASAKAARVAASEAPT